jgi:hypothetical protein
MFTETEYITRSRWLALRTKIQIYNLTHSEIEHCIQSIQDELTKYVPMLFRQVPIAAEKLNWKSSRKSIFFFFFFFEGQDAEYCQKYITSLLLVG